MDIDTFNKFLQNNQEIIRKLAIEKNKEYSRDKDKLHNFKRASEVRRKTPERCLEAMMSKHTISIYDMLDDLDKNIDHSIEEWGQKILDNILYLYLLFALLIERYNININDFFDLNKKNNIDYTKNIIHKLLKNCNMSKHVKNLPKINKYDTVQKKITIGMTEENNDNSRK